jgi:predicted NUDIX family phosphoesterase
LRVILVADRKHLFPGLSPQGFLSADRVDLDRLTPHLFFAERDYMERNSHYKQIIPYLILTRNGDAGLRVLAYQRRAAHTERRLGGLWSIGFGGHIEPLDRTDAQVATLGLVEAAAMRELTEETGLALDADSFTRAGYINSDREDVSSVHFGVVYRVMLDQLPASDTEILATVGAQAEPHRAVWIDVERLCGMADAGGAPDGGTFEDWSRIAIAGAFGTDALANRAEAH